VGLGAYGIINPNSGGGGGGIVNNSHVADGGGGGYGTAGACGQAGFYSVSNMGYTGTATCSLNSGRGGTVYGNTDTSKIMLGSGGGSGSYNAFSTSGVGGNGGGVIAIQAGSVQNFGTISSVGGSGTNGEVGSNRGTYTDNGAGGGGGSGGQVIFKGNNVSLGTNAVNVDGGAGGIGYYYAPNYGGAGGSGRIAVDYVSSKTGSTSITHSGTQISNTSATQVAFGGVSASSVLVVNSTTIKVTAPPHAGGIVDLVLTNPDAQNVTLTGGYTYVAPPPPVISSINPANGPVAGGTNVTITGTNFAAGNPDSYTKFLLHGDGVGATFIDSETTPKAITALGDVTQSVAKSQFGGKSISFDGNGDYLSFTGDSGMTFGAGDFTIDLWFLLNNISGQQEILDARAAPGATPWAMAVINGTQLQWYNGTSYLAPVSLSANTWYHYAVVRSSGVTKQYLNGSQINSFTDNVNYTNGANNWYIGRAYDAALYYFNGYIDELRISKGVARWTANFTPPVSAYGQPPVTFGGTPAVNVQVINPTTITATTPAHVAGVTDVLVTNPDSQIGTLTGGYTYTPPPGSFTITPSSVLKTGGDSITISGSNFISGATVTFGGIPATSVTFVNSTTLTAVAPVQNAGTYDVVVTNPGGQSTTLANGITFTELPPGSFSITPNTGATTGGVSVTITGSNFFPKNTGGSAGWALVSGKTLPTILSQYNSAVVGNTIYFFGGYNGTVYTNTIYSAPVSDPTTWTDTGKKLPGITGGFGNGVAIIGGYIYIFDGGGNGKIYRAPVSDPTTWVDTGKLAPESDIDHIAVIGSNIYMFGGYVAGVQTNKIFIAPVSDPTTWTNTGKVLPSIVVVSQMATINGYIYIFGGYTGSGYLNTIYRASTSDPTTWTTVAGKTLPNTISHAAGSAVIGDYIYIFGGYNGTTWNNSAIYSAPVSDPTTWTNTGNSLSVSGLGLSNPIVIGNYIYLMGGYNGVSGVRVNTIYRAPVVRSRPNIYNLPWMTDWGTIISDQSNVTLGGVLATNINFVNSTSITATTPAHAPGAVDVVVTNWDGQSMTLPNGFTYLPPTISGIVPNSGPAAGGTSVTITGTNFTPAQPGTGGVITTSNGYYTHTFTAGGTFTPPAGVTNVQVLVVGGGGQGGRNGGGGAGGLIYNPSLNVTNQPYAVTVGAGGNAYASEQGANGGNSVFSTLTAIGGGGGAGRDAGGAGKNGGSGGGGGGSYGLPQLSPGSGTAGQGYAGGNGAGDYSCASSGGGGGGAGGVGKNGASGVSGNGGNGVSNSISGSAVYYAGGGGGSIVCAGSGSNGTGGLGGGGTNAVTWVGTPNTGGGGAGGTSAGGSGIVIVRYLIPFSIAFDGVSANNVNFINSTTVTATTPPHAVGPVDVAVTNSDGQSATLVGGYTYNPDRLAIITSILNQREGQPGMLTVQAQDALGNAGVVATDTLVSLSSTASTGFFARDINEDISTRWNYNTVVIPTGQSSVNFYYMDNLKGTPTISASNSSVPQNATQQETITSKFRFIVTGVTNPIKQGVPSSITVQAVDYNNIPLSEYTGTIHFSSTDTSAILPANFAITPSMLGGYTFVNGVSLLTQGSWCVTATDAGDPNITGSQCSISVIAPNAGIPSQIKFITSPQFISVTGGSTPITVQLEDANGAPAVKGTATNIYIFSDSSTALFSANGITSWISEPLAMTIPAGASSINFFYKDSTLGAHILSAGDDASESIDFGLSNDTQTETMTVGNAFFLNVSASLHSVNAGDVTPVTVSLRDSSGNTVSSSINQPIFLSGSNGAVFSNSSSGPWSTVLGNTISVGQTSLAAYVSNTTSGSFTITASDTNPANGITGLVDGTDIVSVLAGVPKSFLFTTPTFQVTAGQVSNAITVKAVDQYGNLSPVVSATPVYLYADQAGGIFSINSIFSTPVTSVTIPAGQSSVPFYFKQSLYNSSTVNITASDNITSPDGATGIDDASQVETIVPGAMYQFATTNSPPVSAAAGAETQIIIYVKNSYGVTIPFSSATTIYLRTSSTSSLHEFSSNPSPSWSPITSLLVSNGINNFSFYYKDTGAGSPNVAIADEPSGADTGILNATLGFNISSTSATTLNFNTTSFSIQAGQVSPVLTLQIKDQYGNPVLAGTSTVVNLTSTSATGKFDTSAGGDFTKTQVTIPSGQSNVQFYYKDLTSGTPTITAHSGILTDATQIETVNWGTPTALHLSVASGNMTAGTIAGPVTITLLNSSGVSIPAPSNFTVNLGSTFLTGKFDTSVAGAFDGSITSVVIPQNSTSINFYYRDTKTGSATITASGLSVTSATTTFLITSDVATQIIFTPVAGQTLEIGQKSASINVSLNDQFGNIVSPSVSTLISLTSSGAQGTFLNASSQVVTGVTILNGQSGAGFYYKDLGIGSSVITAHFASLTDAIQTETIIFGAPKSITLTTSSTNGTVGVPSTQITATLYNNSGQVTNMQGATILSLSSSTGTGRFDTSSAGAFDGSINSITIPDGISSGTFYYMDTTAGLPTVTVSKTGLTSGTINLNLTAAAPASMIFLNTMRTTAAGLASAVYTLQFLDNFGNIKTLTAPITVNLATSAPVTGNFATSAGGPWTTTQITVPPGVSTTSFYYRDTLVGTKTITVSSAPLADINQNANITPGGINHFVFLTGTQTQKVLDSSNVITVQAQDAYNNITSPSSNLTINLSSTSAQYQFSVSSTTWVNITSIQMLANQSVINFYYKDWKVGTPGVKVRDAGAIYPLITQIENIIPTAASQFSITTLPQTVVTDTPSSIVNFSLVDGAGNPSASTDPVIATISANSGTTLFSDDYNVNPWQSQIQITFAPGDITKSFYFKDSAVGTFTISISSAGFVGATTTETIVAGVPAKIVFSGSISTPTGVAVPITLQVQTAENLPIAVSSAKVIPLSDDKGGQFSLTSVPWTPVVNLTIVSGTSQKTIYFKSTLPGTHTITANATSIGLGTAIWTMEELPLNVYQLKILSGPAQLVVNQPSTIFTAQTQDQYGNVVSLTSTDTGGAGFLNLYLYGQGQFASSSGGPWSNNPVQMQLGDNTFSFYFKSGTPGAQILTASDQTPSPTPDTGLLNSTWPITVQGETPTQIIFSNGANTVTAGSFGGLTIGVNKSDGTPAILGSPLVINLSSTWIGGKFTLTNTGNPGAITQVTIPTGTSSVNLYAYHTVVGIYNLSAASTGLTSASQSFTVTGGAPAKLVFTSSGQNVIAGNDSSQMHVQMQDQFGNLATSASSISVSFTTTDSGQFSLNSGAGWQAITSATIPALSGDLYFYYRNGNTGGTYTLSVTDTSGTGLATATQNIIVSAGSVNKIEFASAPFTISSGQTSSQISFFLKDQFGNVVTLSSPKTIYLYSSSGTGIFSGSSDFSSTVTSFILTTGANGKIFYYKDTTVGTPTITVSDATPFDSPDIGWLNATQTETITTGTPFQFKFTDAPTSIIAGNSRVFNVELQNQYGVPVAPAGVLSMYLYSTSVFGRFSLSSDFASSSIIYKIDFNPGENTKTFYYRDSLAGSSVVTASDATPLDIPDTGLLNAIRTQSVLNSSIYSLNFLNAPAALELGEASPLLTIQLRDQFGNTVVSGAPVTVYPYTTSLSGGFATTSNAPTFNITQLLIPSGQSTVSFYYKDTVAGNPVVVVSDASVLDSPDTGILNANQTENISAGSVFRVSFTTNMQSLEVGQASQKITIQLQNSHNVARPVNVDTNVYLTSSSAQGQFATTPFGPWNASFVTVPTGSSSADFYYRQITKGDSTITASDSTPANGPIGWIDGTQNVSVQSGEPSQIIIASIPVSVIARHPSGAITINIDNAEGYQSPSLSNTRLYLRSTNADDEFAENINGPWGISYTDLAAGNTQTVIYFRSGVEGTHTITVSDELPAVPGVGLINATADITVLPQVMDHFLVTNISDPQIQGSPSTVVVEPQDAGDYIFPDYSGNICFTASDADAIIPGCYYFDANIDHGIHSFGNGIAFLSTGEKWVRVNSTTGNYTGMQQNITVNRNGAGPLAKIRFINLPAEPVSIGKSKTSGPFTIGLFDSNDQAVNASTGGYPVMVSSTSPLALFSLTVNGPWTSTLSTNIPAGLSSVNFYYKDGKKGNFTITGSDWQNNRDDIAIANDSFNVVVSGLTIEATTKFESRDAAKNRLVENPIIFNNDGGSGTSLEASATFNLTAKDDITNQPVPVTWDFVFKDVHGNIKDQKSVSSPGTYTLVEYPINAIVPIDSGNWTLSVTATSTDGLIGTLTVPVSFSFWKINILHNQGIIALGTPIPVTVTTTDNGQPEDPSDFTITWLDSGSNIVPGAATLSKSQMTEESPGVFKGNMPTNAPLVVSTAYHMMINTVDQNGTILAQGVHADVQFVNNPALAPKNFQVEKIVTSIPPASEKYDFKFTWTGTTDPSTYEYTLYRTRDRFSVLYDDPCTIEQVQNGDRAAGNCEKTIHMQVVNEINPTSDSVDWVVARNVFGVPGFNSFTIRDAQNLPGNIYYFILRAGNGLTESGLSTMVFVNKNNFNYNSLTSNVNRIGIPFAPLFYTNPAALLNKAILNISSVAVGDIEGGTGIDTNQKINRISLWDPLNQASTSTYFYKAGSTKAWSGTNFSITSGSGIFLEASGNTPLFDWTTVGHDIKSTINFEYNPLTSNVNWVSLPYSGMYKYASDIVRDIEGGTGIDTNQKINRISLWDPANQGSISTYFYKAGNTRSWSGTNFSITPGSGVFIELSGNTQSFSWTPALIVEPYQ
jgi:hypothetical protein